MRRNRTLKFCRSQKKKSLIDQINSTPYQPTNFRLRMIYNICDFLHEPKNAYYLKHFVLKTEPPSFITLTPDIVGIKTSIIIQINDQDITILCKKGELNTVSFTDTNLLELLTTIEYCNPNMFDEILSVLKKFLSSS